MKLKRFTSAALTLLMVLGIFIGIPPNRASAAATDFGFNGSSQSYTVPNTGKYTLEVWGAQGSGGGGWGGYATGEVTLNAGTVLYVFVGGQGGYNGGGYGSVSGGGASDIRTNAGDLWSRLIVAGGGGGNAGGGGGGTSGYNSNWAGAGTQTSGGDGYSDLSNGVFGQGGGGGTGGGGGWYGGGSDIPCNGYSCGGGGGSGYIGGVANGSMQNSARSGDGYARITQQYIPPTVSGFNSYAYSNYTRSDWSIANADSSTKIEIYRNNGLAYSGTSSPFDDTGAVDTAAPNGISNLNVSSSNRYPQISWTGAGDNGTAYVYKARAVYTGGASEFTSDRWVTVTSGIKGYSIVVDANPSTTPDNTIETTSTSISWGAQVSSNFYVHVATVDNQGNISSVAHIQYVDTIKPTMSISYSNTAWTNGNVNLTANAADGETGIKRVQRPDGTWGGTSVVSTATQNGTYTFVAEDNAGNTLSQNYAVSNIDKSLPTATNSYIENVDGNGYDVVVTGVADVGSGINRVQVPSWTSASGQDDLVWHTAQSLGNGTYKYHVNRVDHKGEYGEYITHVYLCDNAGNSVNYKQLSVILDNTPPTVTITPSISTPTNKDIALNAAGSDSESGFRRFLVPSGIANGLRGEYYQTPSLGVGPVNKGTKKLERIDPQVNFTWGVNSPDPQVPAEGFNVVWTGFVQAPVGGNITFQTTSDDGAKLWVNGNQLVDKWLDQGGVAWEGTVSLEPGRWYPIRMEMYENGGGATATLMWKHSGTNGFELIPSQNLLAGTWVNGTSASWNVSSNGTYYVFAEDNAGNTTAKSYNVTNIDNTPPTSPLFVADIVKSTNTNVTVTLNPAFDSVLDEVKVGNGAWAKYTGPVVMTDNGVILARSTDAAGNVSTVSSYTVSNIDRTPPVKATFTADVTEPTKDAVNLTINYPDDASNMFYKIGATDQWKGYNGTIVISDNSTIYSKSQDEAGNTSEESSYVVNNIFKKPPTTPVLTADIVAPTKDNVKVTVTFDPISNTKEYKVGASGTWTAYTTPITVIDSTTVYARSTDVAGNVSAEGTLIVGNIDRTPPSDATFTPSTTSYTGDNVKVTINYPSDADIMEYQLGSSSGEWLYYVTALDIADNTEVFARSKDLAGNISGITSYKVTNIDKTPPADATFIADVTLPTSKSVTVTVSYPSDSTVKEYQLGSTTGEWVEYTGPVFTTENVSIFARSKDIAGNISKVASYDVTNIIKNNMTAPTLVPSTTAPTGNDVTVTINYPASSVKKEYRLDGGAWTAYTSPVAISVNGKVEARATDAADNVSPLGSLIISNIDKSAPVEATFTVDVTTPTSSDVTVVVNYPLDSSVKEYKIGATGTWVAYTAPFKLSSNAAVYARSKNAVGSLSKESVLDVVNIDKTAPTTPVMTPDKTAPTNGDVKVTIVYDADSAVKEYQVGGGNWIRYTVPVTVSANTLVKARATDAAGNISTISSLNITNISKIAPAGATFAADITTATNTDVKVTISYPAAGVLKQYRIGTGAWATYTTPLVITNNTTVYARSQDVSGNWSTETSYVVSNIVKTTSGEPTMYANNAVVETNENVVVTVIYPSDAVTNQYRINGGEWKTYIAPIVMTENGLVEARSLNGAGTPSAIGSLTVSNINKTAPNEAVITADITQPTASDVRITIVYPSNASIKEYHMGETGDNWITYSGPFTVTGNLTVYARSYDSVGNVSPTKTYVVSNINKDTPIQPILTADRTAATNLNVAVTINYSNTAKAKEYRVNGGAWQAYIGPVIMSANGTVEARETSSTNAISAISKLDVSNIDKVAPVDATFTPDRTTSSGEKVNVTVNYPTDASLKQYRIGTGEFLTYTGPVSITTNGLVYARSYDAAGNPSNITSYNVTNILSNVPGTPTIFLNPNTDTPGPIMVTLVFSSDSSWKQYRINGGAWQNYYGPFTITVNSTVEAKGMNNSGVSSSIAKTDITNIVANLPTAPTLTPDKTAITNVNVSVTITYPVAAVTKQYKLGDSGTWTTYTAPVVVTDNQKVYGRYQISTGTWSTEGVYAVNNIDKVAPITPTLSLNSYGPTNNSVIVTISYPADSMTSEYRIDSGAWTKYVGSITVTNNGTIMARSTDTAGNVSLTGTLVVSNVVKSAPGDATFSPDIVTPTMSNVRVTINYPNANDLKQYRIGSSGAWYNYYSPTVIEANTTLFARSLNSAGVYSNIASYNITNIYKTPPALVKLTPDIADWTNGTVKITLTYDQSSSTAEYQVGTTSGAWVTYTGPIVVDINTIIYARAKNVVGLMSGVSSYTVSNIDKTPPNAPTFYASTYGATTQPVTLTLYYPGGTTRPEYRIGDMGAWVSYSGSIVVSSNIKVYARVYDMAGNVSPLATYTVSNITK